MPNRLTAHLYLRFPTTHNRIYPLIFYPYLLELLNLEAEQIGRATDGLITARPIDTQTFEFMKGVPPGSNPKYNIGAGMDPKYRDLSFKEIRGAYDVGDKGPMKA